MRWIEINVFIRDTSFGLNLMRADKQESLPTVSADVETDRVTAKVICNYVDHYAPVRTTLVEIRDLPVGAPRHQHVCRRGSRRLHTTHGGNRTDVEFDAWRIAIV